MFKTLNFDNYGLQPKKKEIDLKILEYFTLTAIEKTKEQKSLEKFHFV